MSSPVPKVESYRKGSSSKKRRRSPTRAYRRKDGGITKVLAPTIMNNEGYQMYMSSRAGNTQKAFQEINNRRVNGGKDMAKGTGAKPIKGDDALYFISLLDKKLIDNNQYQNIMSKQDIDKKIDVVSYQKNLFTISLLQSILNDESIVDNRYLIED